MRLSAVCPPKPGASGEFRDQYWLSAAHQMIESSLPTGPDSAIIHLLKTLLVGRQLVLDPATGSYRVHSADTRGAVDGALLERRTIDWLVNSGVLTETIGGICELAQRQGLQDTTPAVPPEQPKQLAEASSISRETSGDDATMALSGVSGGSAEEWPSPRALAGKGKVARLTAPALQALDRASVGQWLNELVRKKNTLAAYKREARRFLMWLHTVEGDCLRTFDRAGVERYLDFLKEPDPNWLAPGPDGWKPLKGALSPDSLRQALIILQSMFRYLNTTRKVICNPFEQKLDKGPPPQRLVKPVPSREAIARVERWLSDWCAQAGPVKARQRRRDALLWVWLYWTAARRFELAWATFGQLVPDSSEGDIQWWWVVQGKGEKVESIPLDHHAVHALLCYHQITEEALIERTGLQPDRSLWNRLRKTADAAVPLTADAVYDGVRRVAKATSAAADVIGLNPVDMNRIAETTPHRLRAYRNTHLFGEGKPGAYVQRLMRHANYDTTQLYNHTENRQYHQLIVGPRPPVLGMAMQAQLLGTSLDARSASSNNVHSNSNLNPERNNDSTSKV